MISILSLNGILSQSYNSSINIDNELTWSTRSSYSTHLDFYSNSLNIFLIISKLFS